MAYAPRELKIYPGGLNLVAPGDQVNDGDSLDLADWWPSSSGRLEQSPQLVLQSSPDGNGSNMLLESDGNVYYGGPGGNLFVEGFGFLDSSFDGSPLGAISFLGWAWFMNPRKQRRWQSDGAGGFTGFDWWPGNPYPGLTITVLPGQGALNAHEYEYFLTWVIQGLGETNPAPVAPITVNAGDAVQLNRPDLSDAPGGATGWNIYRQNYIDSSGIGVFGLAYLLNPVPIPLATAVYVDTGQATVQQDDTSLAELGVILEQDHDGPPPAKVVANQTFNGRIVVANSAEFPNRIWWTKADQPAFFPGANNPNSGQWADIGTDTGDDILAIAVRPLTLIIYRRKSIWRVLGDFDDPNSRIDPMVPELGIAGVRAMVSTSVGDYFVASAGRGAYSFNNDWAAPISPQIDPIFRGLPTENFPTLGKGYESQIAVGFRNGRLWVSYPLADGNPAGSFIYHLASQRWFAGSSGYGAFLDIGSQFLGVNGGVFALEDKYVGGSTIVRYQTQYHNVGLPDHEKNWADLVINHNTQGETLTITIRINKNVNPTTDSFIVATLVSNAMTKTIIPLVYPSDYVKTELRGEPIIAYSLSVRITGNGADDTPILIDGPLILHYYLEARRAKTFDSAATDHGTGLVKIVDQVQFDIDANKGPATLQVKSDVPGGVMIPRLGSSGQTVPQTTHRGSEILVLSKPSAGRLIRYQVTTPTDMAIFGLRARILPIGVYLDGSIGDFWQPTAISIGV